MPATDARPGGLRLLEICTGQGAVTVQIDVEGKSHLVPQGQGEKRDSKSDHPCAFAAASAAAEAAQTASLAQPVRFLGLDDIARLSTQRPGLGLAAPPPPKTGPPSII